MLEPEKVYINYTHKDEQGTVFFEDVAIVQLLEDGVLFASSHKYGVSESKNSQKGDTIKVLGETITLFVVCSDIFAWGCADAEDLPMEKVESLYALCLKYPNWGSAIWCCLQRNEKPQSPVAKKMKEENCWPEELDKLNQNRYDNYLKDQNEAKNQ